MLTTPGGTKYIEFDCARYLLNAEGTFAKGHVHVGETYAEVHSRITGLSAEEYTANMDIVGRNVIAYQADTVYQAAYP